ncbi:hypothetical protein F753_12530 [Stutzerimonas chloritidismutans AW-1]|uniref:Uncharacterized protein n=1 Tax=Stutzerimonas chloritidismutans AW-1 TaxID=1263865 RepID=V4Q8M1_STUCH|nr:hypothetical protein F753_12530 [Stutzerimonas chloritidismutans AW-1]
MTFLLFLAPAPLLPPSIFHIFQQFSRASASLNFCAYM